MDLGEMVMNKIQKLANKHQQIFIQKIWDCFFLIQIEKKADKQKKNNKKQKTKKKIKKQNGKKEKNKETKKKKEKKTIKKRKEKKKANRK